MTAHRLLICIIAFVYCLLSASTVFAGDPPTLTSPSNNSTVTSSTLNWQAPSYSLYSTDPYRVQVDDDPSFPSATINKDYRTKNPYYSPVLNEGVWYWRVKAKDSSGIWSNWSGIWSFTLQTSSPATPTPTPSPTPSSTSPSSTVTSSFTVSDVPSQINSDQSFNVSANLSLPNNPDATFYLKGAFKKADSSNYFGLTKVSGIWIKNGSSYSEQYRITTNSTGNWSGNLEVQPDSGDSGFTGSGDYIFKVGRYTSSGSGPTWSNEATINLIDVNGEGIKGGTDLQTATINNNQPQKSSAVKGLTKTNIKKNFLESSASPLIKQYTPQAQQSTSSVQIKNNNSKYPLVIMGSILIILGAGSIIYLIWQKKLKLKP